MSRGELNTVFLHDVFQRMAAGDQTAREDLLRASAERLERLTRKMLQGFPGVRRWEETNDVLQTSLVKLIRAIDSVQPASTREFVGLAAEQIRRVLIDFARHDQGPLGMGTHHRSGVLQKNDDTTPQLDPVATSPSSDEIDR